MPDGTTDTERTADRGARPAGGRAAANSTTSPRFVIGRALGTVVVTVHGELVGGDWAELAGLLVDLIDGQGNLSLVVDVGDVDAIDESAARVLAGAASRVARRGGAFRLHRPCTAVAEAVRRADETGLSGRSDESVHRAVP